MIDKIMEHHNIVLPTYVIDELKRVTREKFPQKYSLLEPFFRKLADLTELEFSALSYAPTDDTDKV